MLQVLDRQVAVLIARGVQGIEDLRDQLPSGGREGAADSLEKLVKADVAIAAAVEEAVQSAHLLQREAQLAHRAALCELLHIQ